MMKPSRLQRRASVRYLIRHRAQSALAIVGIALGAAMVIAISLSQHSAQQEFARALKGLFGNSTHRVTHQSGNVNIETLAKLRSLAPSWQPQPVIENQITISAAGESVPVTLYGFDPLSAEMDTAAVTFDLSRFLREHNLALLDRTLIKQLELASEASFLAQHGASNVRLKLLGDIRALRPHSASSRYLVVDLATAQELLNIDNNFSYIELTIEDDTSPQRMVEIATELGGQISITSHGRNLSSAKQLTQAFNTNLNALAMLSLLVGSFMIYNTLSYLVTQRQALFARLQALGVPATAIAGQVLFEAWILASCGAVVGSFAGAGLANLLIEPLSITLGDHYYHAGNTAVSLNYKHFLATLGLTFVVATVAALAPAWRALKSHPSMQMRFSSRRSDDQQTVDTAAMIGICACLCSAAVLSLTDRSLSLGFVGLGLFVVGAMVLTPYLVQAALALFSFGMINKLPYAAKLGIRQSQETTPILAAALAATVGAVATSIGIGLMVASFRIAVVDWLDQLLRADIFVSVAQQESPVLTDADAEQLLRNSHVIAISKVRRLQGKLADTEIALTAYALPAAAKPGFRFLQGHATEVWARWDQPDTAIVSEPFAWRHGTAVGDRLSIDTPLGKQSFEVLGIYRDYASEQGVVAINWENYQRLWRDSRAHGFGLYVANGTRTETVIEALNKQHDPGSNTQLWSNAAVKAESIRIFDRTFLITDATSLLATLIAALAVFNALLTLNLEQYRVHAIFNALGMRRRTMRLMLYCQNSLVIGLVLLLAAPIGTAVSLLLINIINVRSFGWSMDFSATPLAYIMPMGIAFVFAAAAMWYPIEKALRAEPARMLNDD